MTEVNFVLGLFRNILGWITAGVFSAIEWVMIGIFDIADLQANPDLAADIRTKIYIFLGIFMLFKLSLTLIKYMLSPESMSDSGKGSTPGAGKLVARIFTMMVLLMILPYLFGFLGRVQLNFLPVIPRILFGTNTEYATGDSEARSEEIKDSANKMATGLLGAFYRPYCEDNSCITEDGDVVNAISSIDDMMDTIDESVEVEVDGETKEVYAYDFNLFAPVIGIIAIFVLFKITVDIAIRVFKMFILEILAPIPIISYIDPKASKDGAFAAWTKQLISTFLDIFVRLGVVYLVIFFVQYQMNDSLFSNLNLTGTREGYVKAFIIIALLLFAKDAPNFIKDVLGIKREKGTSGVLAGISAAVTGGATGLVSGAISGRGFRGAVTGAAVGVSTGYNAGSQGKKASAWRAAGDAAVQARTGDSKAKSGILAQLQTKANEAQLKDRAKKYGVTEDTLKQAKGNMLSAASDAADASDKYERAMTIGIFDHVDGSGNPVYRSASQAELDALRADRDNKNGIADAAKRNYEKANKVGDTYKVNTSWEQDVIAGKKKAKKEYKSGTITKAEYERKSKFDPNKRS